MAIILFIHVLLDYRKLCARSRDRDGLRSLSAAFKRLGLCFEHLSGDFPLFARRKNIRAIRAPPLTRAKNRLAAFSDFSRDSA
jgi:hypothetical protein